MVQTRSATKKVQQPAETQELAASAEHNAPVQQRSKRTKICKNARETKGTSRRTTTRGKLAMLPEINLDVLSLVLSYLHPMDLLHLARLTRPFRQFLMSKSHAFLWVAARKQVDGLPECPPDMSEPEYAHLAFYPHCHGCDRVVRTIYWNIRRRYCPECRDERYWSASSLIGLHRCSNIINQLLPLEYLKWTAKKGDYYVDKEQYDAFCKEYAQVPLDKKKGFITRRREMATKIKEHANQCEEWLARVATTRGHELSKARTARNDSIFARLKVAGYEREVRHWGKEYIMESRPEVFRSSKRLTDKDWEAVYPKLEPKMTELRERRMEEKVYYPRRTLLINLYHRYIQHPAPEGGAVDLLPSIADVARFAPFDAVLRLPEDETVDETTFKPAFDQLPALARQWKEEIDARLVSLVNFGAHSEPYARKASTQTVPKRQDTSLKEPLKLACAVFAIQNASDCRSEVLTYPHILAKLCTSFGGIHLWHSERWSLPPREWNFVELFPCASDVVRACGLDPRTATVDDMDRVNARLICNLCGSHNLSGSVEVFDWKSAIHHAGASYLNHASRQTSPWTLLDENLVAKVEAVEKAHVCSSWAGSRVYCALCQRCALATTYDLSGDLSSSRGLSAHLDSVHGVEETDALQENVHYIVPWDGLNDFRPTLRMFTKDEVSFEYWT